MEDENKDDRIESRCPSLGEHRGGRMQDEPFGQPARGEVLCVEHGGHDMNPRNTVITPATATVNVSPIGFHRYASEFATYARQAQAGLGGTFSPVPYYLYCRSLELVLKAFLLAKGVAKDDLKGRNLGHDLWKNLLKARGLGLEQTIPFAAHWEDEIRKANSYYASKGFEYFDVIAAARGYPQLPALDALNEIVTALLERLQPICLSA